jgi:hypothetical protein
MFYSTKEGNVMLSRLRLMLIGLFVSFALIACGGEDANTTEAADTATEAESTGEAAATPEAGAAEGKSEAELIEQYGEPDVTQETSVDDYTVVFHEWHTDEGTLSVQVHNGEVAYTQFNEK